MNVYLRNCKSDGGVIIHKVKHEKERGGGFGRIQQALEGLLENEEAGERDDGQYDNIFLVDLAGQRLRLQVVNTKGAGGDRIIPTTSGHAINTKGMGCNDRMAAPGGDPYFDIFATDDIVIAERFDPWGQGSEGTETLTIHRTPVGEISSVSNNGDLLAVYDYDTAGRCVSLDLPTVEKRTDTLDACGNPTESVLLCRSTIPGTPDETFTTTATYDAASRCVSSSDSIGNTDLFAYDSMDRCTLHTGPNGLVIHCDYDIDTPGSGFSSVRQWCDYNNDNLQDQIFSNVILCGD
jgi:hypothetical protein